MSPNRRFDYIVFHLQAPPCSLTILGAYDQDCKDISMFRSW
jgi:hypothetical protein